MSTQIDVDEIEKDPTASYHEQRYLKFKSAEGVMGDINRAVIAHLESIGIIDHALINNIIGNGTVNALSYCDRHARRDPVANADAVKLQATIDNADVAIAKLLKRPAGSTDSSLPEGMAEFYEKNRKIDGHFSDAPKFTTDYGQTLSVLEIEYVFTKQAAVIGAKIALDQLGTTVKDPIIYADPDAPKSREIASLAQMEETPGPYGEAARAAIKRARDLGLKDDTQLAKLIDSALNSIRTAYQGYDLKFELNGKEAADTMLVRTLVSSSRGATRDKADLLGVPSVRGKSPNARIPGEMIAFFEEHAARPTDDRNITIANQSDKPLTISDVRDLLLSDIKPHAIAAFTRAAGIGKEFDTALNTTQLG